jgi:hypothetical protein
MKVYQQETEYSCGGSVLKTLLDYYELLGGRSEADLSKALKTGFGPPNPGTHPDEMVKTLEHEGLEVKFGEHCSLEEIYHYIGQDIPVIALDSTWGGHWRIIIGYDFHGSYDRWEDNELFFADPEYRVIEANVDNLAGITTENESRFFYEWYENRLFEKNRENFCIVAYPQNTRIISFKPENL